MNTIAYAFASAPAPYNTLSFFPNYEFLSDCPYALEAHEKPYNACSPLLSFFPADFPSHIRPRHLHLLSSIYPSDSHLLP